MLITTEAAATCSPGFQHEPLPHPITHIRLLEVLPAANQQDTVLQCRLRAVRLSDYDGCYTALSYTWDHRAATQSIYVNGVQLEIRNNLYNILQQYRDKLKLNVLPTVFIWVDALCLDHANVRERNSQVQIMPSIFAKAKTVLAWLEPTHELNEHEGDRKLLPSFVEFLSKIQKDLERPQNDRNDKYLTETYCPKQDLSSWKYAKEWRLLADLCQHHYWSRLWVLLENRFANNLMFLHYDCLWSWSQFRAPFLLIWYLTEWNIYKPMRSSPTDLAQIMYSPALDIIQSRLSFEPASKFASGWYDDEADFRYEDVATERWQSISDKLPLPDLLHLHRGRRCSERMDKIYALIGLSDSEIGVDYGRSNIELFCTVLLSLKVSLDVDFVSMLAHHLGVSAFQYEQNRRSIIKDIPSTMPRQSATDIIGHKCDRVLAVRTIPARTEISDVLQARFGLQKLKHFQITAQRRITPMKHWRDFQDPSKDMPRIHGFKPGTNMPIVDGFDLSDSSFRAAMFLNPYSSGRRAVFGMISTDSVQDGDILVAEESMHSAIIIRISGLAKTWLTVVGVALFAQRVTVESEFSSGLDASSPTCTIRSTSLSDFCERTSPTPFTIIGCDDKEHFTLKPHDIQIQNMFSRPGTSSGRSSRTSTNTARSSTWSRSTTATSNLDPDDRRQKSQSDRLERLLEAITIRKRSKSSVTYQSR